MVSIELYINNQLCDISDINDVSFYLKRQLLNPTELKTKDAQKSYDIVLPATAINNSIFGYKNTEEATEKFAKLYDARLIVNGLEILNGKFKISEITKHTYKGNLGVPTPKTAKDVFGETMMNKGGEILGTFKGLDSITDINTDNDGKFIIPLVLYRLPRRIKGSARNVIDANTDFSLDDFPISVNCLEIMTNIFDKQGYKISGTAFADERLKNLYMSYKNPNDYEMQWGGLSIEVKGEWQTAKNNQNFPNQVDAEVFYNTKYPSRSVHISKSRNVNQTVIQDYMNSVKTGLSNKEIVIPQSAVYKIEFEANIELVKLRYLVGPIVMTWDGEPFNNAIYDIKLLRNHDPNYQIVLDDNYYKDNYNQTNENPPPETSVSGYVYPNPESKEFHFIDPLHNKHFISGFRWGTHDTSKHPQYDNKARDEKCTLMAITGGESWKRNKDFDEDDNITDARTYSVVKNKKGYVAMTEEGIKPRDEFKVALDNVPESFINMENIHSKDSKGSGKIYQLVYLEKGDIISLATSTNYYKNWHNYKVNYHVTLTPFQASREWIKIDDKGSSTEPMKWDDQSSFAREKLNLFDFLPSNMKIDEWITEFCKAFNLDLVQTEEKEFKLNTKGYKSQPSITNRIDLDSKANIAHAKNQSLGLPDIFELGFTINNSEGGYSDTKEDGGGKFETGSADKKSIVQKSKFSYNWYKEVFDERNKLDKKKIAVPNITESEIWDEKKPYNDVKEKVYYDKPLRFWFRTGKTEVVKVNSKNVKLALVSNEFLKDDKLELRLDYKDQPKSITSEYFVLMKNNSSNYTTIEAYLTPEEYMAIDHSYAKLNGDLYLIAEIDGYDPKGLKKATLKLIKK